MGRAVDLFTTSDLFTAGTTPPVRAQSIANLPDLPSIHSSVVDRLPATDTAAAILAELKGREPQELAMLPAGLAEISRVLNGGSFTVRHRLFRNTPHAAGLPTGDALCRA